MASTDGTGRVGTGWDRRGRDGTGRHRTPAPEASPAATGLHAGAAAPRERLRAAGRPPPALPLVPSPPSSRPGPFPSPLAAAAWAAGKGEARGERLGRGGPPPRTLPRTPRWSGHHRRGQRDGLDVGQHCGVGGAWPRSASTPGSPARQGVLGGLSTP